MSTNYSNDKCKSKKGSKFFRSETRFYEQVAAATVAKTREQRLTALREGAPALEREAVDESDLARALEIFDPVWAALAAVR